MLASVGEFEAIAAHAWRIHHDARLRLHWIRMCEEFGDANAPVLYLSTVDIRCSVQHHLQVLSTLSAESLAAVTYRAASADHTPQLICAEIAFRIAEWQAERKRRLGKLAAVLRPP